MWVTKNLHSGVCLTLAYKVGGCVQKGPQVESFSFDDFHKVLAWKSFLEIRQDLAMGPSIDENEPLSSILESITFVLGVEKLSKMGMI